MAVLSGSAQLRPVRVALALAPGAAPLLRGVQLATSAWGGLHFPLIPSDDTETARELARISASDVIVAVDKGDGAAQVLAGLPGFRWKPSGQWGPFEPPAAYRSCRLLGPEANLHRIGAPRIRPAWQAADPLAALFGVWFGEYGTSAYENTLREAFEAAAAPMTLVPGTPVPALGDAVSPLELTAADIEYAGFYSETGIVVLDPENPSDLVRFWNLRALGNRVFPWPIGYEARVREACAQWLRAAKKNGRINTAVRGSDHTQIELLSIWPASGGDASIPAVFDELAHEHGLELCHGAEVFDVPPRSRASHPLVTTYTRRFSLTIAEGEFEAAVPLPDAPFSVREQPDAPTRIIAAQIGITRESGLGAGKTFAVPNARKLSGLLDSYLNFPEIFNRPAAEGRVVAVGTGAEQVYIRAVPTETVLDAMLKGSNWTASRSASGRFATQLIERLGGAHSTAGNQPAVRWVLDTAARSPYGKPIPALINSARKAQGAWPNTIFNAEQHNREYPERIVRYLLARRILRPALPVECPECTTTAYLAPESLATDYSCDMCGKANPLGLILSLHHQNPWHYKTAGTLTAEQIAETMPIMAAVNVLHGLFRTAGGDCPHVLGLKVTEGKAWSCEVDLALLADERGAPLVVIGEVKSYLDPISTADLANLAKLQRYFRSEGFECVILAATLHERIEGEELRALRQACEQAPHGSVDRFASLHPVLPLVLTAKELSAPEHTDHHPNSWGVYDILEQAQESCRRNLGLSDVDYIGGGAWRLSWTEQPEAST